MKLPLTRIPHVIDVAAATGIRPLFIGAPGIGKTAMIARSAVTMAQRRGRKLVALSPEAAVEARMLGVDAIVPGSTEELLRLYEEVRRRPEEYFVYLRIVATQVTPEDLQYPRLHNGAVVNVAPLKLAFLTIPGVEGLLFIDEITNVQREDALTMFFAMVNEGQVGLAGQLSDGVVVAAAGNPPEVSSVAEELPAPLVNRFAVYKVRPPTAQEVASYIIAKHGERAHEAVVSYLLSSGRVYEPPRDRMTLENYPTPRSWERAAVAAREAEKHGEDVLMSTLTALLGEAVAAEIKAYLKARPPSIDKLLEKPRLYEKLETEQKILATVMLYARIATEVFRGERLEKLADLMYVISQVDTELFEMLKTLAYNSRTGRKNIVDVITILSKKGKLTGIINKLVEALDIKLSL